jgi:hypothetical protein
MATAAIHTPAEAVVMRVRKICVVMAVSPV